MRSWKEPPSAEMDVCTANLYNRNSNFQLPFASLEFKVRKARLTTTLRDSKDDKVRAAGVEVKTGRKWSVSKAVILRLLLLLDWGLKSL